MLVVKFYERSVTNDSLFVITIIEAKKIEMGEDSCFIITLPNDSAIRIYSTRIISVSVKIE